MQACTFVLGGNQDMRMEDLVHIGDVRWGSNIEEEIMTRIQESLERRRGMRDIVTSLGLRL